MYKLLLFLLLFSFAAHSQFVMVKDTIRFLALGDSYTIGQSVAVNERWPIQLKDSLISKGVFTQTLQIIATTGWRTDNLLNAISGQNLKNKNFNLVSLLIGVNNQYQGSPFSQYTTEFPALLDSALSFAGGIASHVFVVSIPDYAYTPYGQSTSNPSLISSQLAQYNQFAKSTAASKNVKFFNITPISQQGLQYPNYVAADGLHPSGVQYSKWVKLMLDSIKKAVPTGLIKESIQDFELHVYPNPATTVLNIKRNFNDKIARVEIYNLTGQLKNSPSLINNDSEINISDLASGLYTLRLISSGHISQTKFVKLPE